MSERVTVVRHPLVQNKLSILRGKNTDTGRFRQTLRELSFLLCYEITRDLPLTEAAIETPVAPMTAPVLADPPPVFAPILRAGLGLVDGMLDLIPSAHVAHIGIYRDPASFEAKTYYFKAPPNLERHAVIVVDPMLATGNTAVAAIEQLQEQGARDIRFACALAAPEGIEVLRGRFPELPIWTAAVDSHLNEKKYIVPGLGDAGDRIFAT